MVILYNVAQVMGLQTKLKCYTNILVLCSTLKYNRDYEEENCVNHFVIDCCHYGILSDS